MVLLFAGGNLQAGESYHIPLSSGILELQKGDFETEGARYLVIQFQSRLKRKDVEELRSLGINPLSFLYRGAWLCSVAPGALTGELRDRFAITAAAPWKAEYKMSRRLQKREFREWAVTEDGRIKLLVSFFEDVSRQEMEQVLGQYDPGYAISGAPTTWAIRIHAADIENLLREPAVQWVEEGPKPFQPLNDRARAIVQVDPVQAADLTITPPDYLGLSGWGVNIAVSETVYTDHPDFWDHDAAGDPIASRFLNTGGANFHGTHVAGIIGGNGWNSARDDNPGTPYQWRGMAPEATLISGSGYGSFPVDASNHSYVMEQGEYGTTSHDVDKDIRRGNGFERRKPHIWAAANQGLHAQWGDESGEGEEGYYSIYAPAKNPICVGAVNANDGSLVSGSSLGPTFDGRIKPDVMAPGCNNFLLLEFPLSYQVSVEIDYIRILDGPGTVVLGWEFDTPGDFEGWSTVRKANIFDEQVSGGVLSFKLVLGGYAFIENLDLEADSSHTMEMRYRIQQPYDSFDQYGQIWWLDRDYVPDPKVKDVYVGKILFDVFLDNEFHVAEIPVGEMGLSLSGDLHYTGLNGWKGTIKRLRIDPGGGSRGIVSPFFPDGLYIDACGTSMAAPVVTGTVALMLQQFVEAGKFVGDAWEAVDLDINPPLPSTIKAILIQTATDLIHTSADPRDPDNPDTGSPVLYYEGPDFATGYGLINAEAAVELIVEAVVERHIHEAYMLEGTHEYEFTLSSPLPELKITLAWDDVEGNPALDQTLSKLVNDLDIVVVDPYGNRHYPWSLDPLPVADCGGDGPGCGDPDPITPGDIQPACKDEDHRNNVEQVQVESPQAGTWRVLVNGDGIQDVTDGRQAYSLVSNVPLTKKTIDPTQPITPIIEYVNEVDGTYTVYFGYHNPNPYVVVVELGPDNQLRYSGQGSLRNPITKFQPGDNPGIFSMNFDGAELSWTLNGTTVSTTEAEIRHLRITPILDRVEDHCDGTFTAYFGYENPHAFAVVKQIGYLNEFDYEGYGDFWENPITEFEPGENHEVFPVLVEDGQLTWKLDGHERLATRQMASNTCPPFRFYKAFAFGPNSDTRAVPNAPQADYIKVVQGGDNFMYDPARGYGYTAITGLDDSPNNRDRLSGDDEIYDQFIGVKNLESENSTITFRVDVPPGTYRLVAAGGDARYPNHVTTLTVTNGYWYDQKPLVKKQQLSANTFYRVGFDDKTPPAGDGSGTQPEFLELVESPFVRVYPVKDVDPDDEDYRDDPVGSYIEIIQKADGPIGLSGGDLCLIELWYRPDIASVTEGHFDKALEGPLYNAASHTFKISPANDYSEPNTKWRSADRFFGFRGIDEITVKHLECDGSRRRYAVGWHAQDLIEYLLELGGEYGQLILRGKADRPGPVRLSVFIDGEFYQEVNWDADDNCSQDVVVDVSAIAHGDHAVAVRFDEDKYGGPGKPDLDRNLYLEGMIVLPDDPYQYKLIEPQGRETYFIGEEMPIRWVAGEAAQAADISISFDGGDTFILLNKSGSIVRDDPEWGHYVFTIPTRFYDPNQGKHILPASTQCLIRIEEYMDPSISDTSASVFTIANQYKLIEPNGWETYYVGKQMPIRWLAAEGAQAANLWISFDGGDTFSLVNRAGSITYDDPEWGHYPWTIPEQIIDSYGNLIPTNSTQCRIRIEEHMDPNLADESDDDFTIVKPVDIVAVSTGKDYHLAIAEPGVRAYMDRSYTVAAISSGLRGGVLVQTANSDKNVAVSEHLKLRLDAYAWVYVCYDQRAKGKRPDWLDDGWTAEADLSVVTTDSPASPLTVYSQYFCPDEYWFGGNLHGGDTGARSHYLLIVVPTWGF
jgi:subtilisin family serine protease